MQLQKLSRTTFRFVCTLLLTMLFTQFQVLGIAPDVWTYADLAYVEEGHPLQKLDLYLPKESASSRPLPLVVWIHGGGWQKGDKDRLRGQSILLENGFALASVNYRLTSHAPFPAQIHDCKAAIRFLRKHAETYGIDPEKIGVWGSSAGGHLAALLGVSGGVAELEGDLGVVDASSRVRAVCDWFGPTDFITMGQQLGRRGGLAGDATNSPIAKLLGGAINRSADAARRASPATYITDDDPPFLIMHGDQDRLVPIQQSEDFHRLLGEASIQSEFLRVEGHGHRFFDEPEDLDHVVRFFEANLKDEWIQLFNGRDLDDWIPKIRGHEAGDNYADTFRVKNGLLVVSYDKYKPEDLVNMDGKKKTTFDKFGHLFHKDTFSHYVLRIEYRFVGDQIENGPAWALRNNGIMIHGQDPQTMKVDQKFPVSLEVQLLGGNGVDDRATLNLCTPGTSVVVDGELIHKHVVPSSAPTFHGDQWVTAEVEVRGNEVVRHKIGGQTVLEYTHPQYDERSKDPKPTIVDGNLMLGEGTISIQSESHSIEFRKIELRRLDPGA